MAVCRFSSKLLDETRIVRDGLLAKTGALEQPFQFSTKRFDELTGLSYYGYRFYSPEMGRWTTRDPLGEAGGINLYAFVGDNPVNWVDRV